MAKREEKKEFEEGQLDFHFHAGSTTRLLIRQLQHGVEVK